MDRQPHCIGPGKPCRHCQTSYGQHAKGCPRNGPRVAKEYSLQSVPDHEVLLVFNGDDDALQFHQWWESKGWRLFDAWLDRKNPG